MGIQFQTSKFTEIELDQLTEAVAERKRAGFGFVQLCANTMESSLEFLYTFTDPDAEAPGTDNLVVDVPDGTPIPSITQFYPAAFVFENEAHDLFGADIQGINIDFKGEFYTVAVAYPMNPRAAVAGENAPEAAEGEEASNE